MIFLCSRAAHSAVDVYHTARAAHQAGISCIPIRGDGTKSPAVRWKTYQHQQPSLAEVKLWFSHSSYGLAFITGRVSGGLELLDFDTRDIYQAWAKQMRVKGLTFLLERLERGYLEETPHGIHLLYRCARIEGNQKLARKCTISSTQVTSLIETRGEGGYGIVAPSGGQVHPSGQPYRLVRGGIKSILTITQEERHNLFALARTFDEVLPTDTLASRTPHMRAEQECDGLRPGDRYNQTVSWDKLLPRYGWELVRSVGEQGWWRRPGKRDDGISATTNYAGSDLLYVFSTSTCFESERGYSKFAAYALLEHGGDFAAAARTFAQQGYRDEKE